MRRFSVVRVNRRADGQTLGPVVLHLELELKLVFSWAITRECIRCVIDCSDAGESH